MKLATFLIAASFTTAAIAAPETYNLEPSHSLPRFEYNHLGYSQQLSRFDTISGTITIDRAAKTGAVDVTIDANSVDSGYTTFNNHLKGEDLFDTAKYPTITYKSNKVNFEGDKVASVDGELTVKGITKPVKLTVKSFMCAEHPMLHKMTCGVTATAVIKRSEFKVDKGVPYVSDEVTLTLPVEAIKQ
jgi:polyisoprenoid-binding protein YceI